MVKALAQERGSLPQRQRPRSLDLGVQTGAQKYLLCIRNVVNSTYLQRFHDNLPRSQEPSCYKSNAELRLLLQAPGTSDRQLLHLGTKRAKLNRPSPGALEAAHTEDLRSSAEFVSAFSNTQMLQFWLN